MPTGTHKRVARGRRAGLAAALTVAALTLATAGALAATPKRGAAPYSFAVVSSVIDVPADEPAAQRLFEAIARERSVAFVVYAGDIKGAKEACRDSLYAQRGAILSATRVPLVFIPGNHDWVTCGTAAGGGYDPVERLDFLRQTLLADTALPDPGALPITRESEVARFRPYRENARWIRDDVVYVALNAPAPNNHFLTAGGRNGEFEDRVIANGFWLDHAAEFAKRREARAMAVIFEGDPQFDRYERAERFAWLRFNRPRARDGFRELKRALVKAAATFRGPILVMHASGEPLANGFLIDRPLHADDGALVGNVTRVAFGPRHPAHQWVKVNVSPARQTVFSVSLQDVPKDVPVPPALPAAPRNDVPLPQMPEIPALPALPDASSVAPPLQGDGTTPAGASWPAPPPASGPASGQPASSVQGAP
ncbi:metallophosphoesterase [Burkholderia vietnamiensis]|jgi:hypothetical protein|uniref:metallophosphoesterase n=1 Tax=Burkholderia vietnamiensis TaxID=60552 RepID=UPI0007587F3E|nr:metallophosphoesterase family protein [Burkholderia vietnamiensis]AOK10521.1 hypothetical protein WK31_09895 [Burkholderia vietnamiensis]KVF34485.1 hypothetical protein WJ08_05455 [Burkholderia vietnamiensis]KVF42501.1 hypothetical protein WJ10_12355 [Burkholderia vietnamiensis]KVF80286.1 hypothetical protein WJ18_13085 [Burkholderia vietnamiensis]KVF86512.1 hypothetical protein WJ19_00740 [Burkholderia vietnamiensis]